LVFEREGVFGVFGFELDLVVRCDEGCIVKELCYEIMSVKNYEQIVFEKLYTVTDVR
jgi:hypothetical protein